MHIISGCMVMDVDLTRFEEQFKKAQYQLDGEVMASMEPLMPMLTGSFIQVTRAASAAVQGTGMVFAGVGPHARYLYEGVAMVNSATGKGPRYIPDVGYRWPLGAKLVPSGRPLRYTRAGVEPHWFDAAKARDGEMWIQHAKETAGGG